MKIAVCSPGRLVLCALLVAASAMAGCASTATPRPSSLATTTLADVRHVVVVAAGDSKFAVERASKEPGRDFEEIMKWLPYKEIVVPIARALYWGVSWLVDSGRASTTVPPDLAAGKIVTDAFTETLQAHGPFEWIVATDREPVGDARRGADAIVRLSVPSWGIMPVRDGDPPLVSAFADVRVQVVLRETGVVAWQYAEDVTHPDRLSLDAMTADRALTRDELVSVLERAGHRLANELIYASGGAR